MSGVCCDHADTTGGAAEQIDESQLDGSWGCISGVLLHLGLKLQLPVARCPQALELPCTSESVIGRRAPVVTRGATSPAWHSLGELKAGGGDAATACVSSPPQRQRFTQIGDLDMPLTLLPYATRQMPYAKCHPAARSCLEFKVLEPCQASQSSPTQHSSCPLPKINIWGNNRRPHHFIIIMSNTTC